MGAVPLSTAPSAEIIATPGAAKSGLYLPSVVGPTHEKLATELAPPELAPGWLSAPTAMTFFEEAGEPER
jgi:hypothetical protein